MGWSDMLINYLKPHALIMHEVPAWHYMSYITGYSRFPLLQIYRVIYNEFNDVVVLF